MRTCSYESLMLLRSPGARSGWLPSFSIWSRSQKVGHRVSVGKSSPSDGPRSVYATTPGGQKTGSLSGQAYTSFFVVCTVSFFLPSRTKKYAHLMLVMILLNTASCWKGVSPIPEVVSSY